MEKRKELILTAGPSITQKEISYVNDAVTNGWNKQWNKYIVKLEEKFAEYIGVKHAISTSSCTGAMHLALKGLGIKEGDEVIVPETTWIATAAVVTYLKAKPVFVDIEKDSWGINPESIKAAITDKTKAIMPVHLYGNTAEMDFILKFAKEHNLKVIEDASQGVGVHYKGRHVGTFGDIATLSFYPAHHITMGEGGAVFTNNGKLKMIAESFRDWGRDCFCAPGKNNTCGKRFEWKLGELPEGYDHKYTYSHLGYNLKITDMQAAVGLGQLTKLSEFIQTRQENFSYLKNELEQFKKYLILPESTPKSKPSWFGFPITVKESAPFSKNDLVNFLSSKLIDTRPLFAGNITKQPYFTNTSYRVVGNLKNTDLIMCNTFWIGVFPGLTKEMLEYILSQFNVFIKKYI